MTQQNQNIPVLYGSYNICSIFATLIANGDDSGLSNLEVDYLEGFLFDIVTEGYPLVYEFSEESFFANCDVLQLGADCLEVKIYQIKPDTRSKELKSLEELKSKIEKMEREEKNKPENDGRFFISNDYLESLDELKDAIETCIKKLEVVEHNRKVK